MKVLILRLNSIDKIMLLIVILIVILVVLTKMLDSKEILQFSRVRV